MIAQLYLDDGMRAGFGWRDFLILKRGRKLVTILAISSFDKLTMPIAKFDAMKKRPVSYSKTRLLRRLRVNADTYSAPKGTLAMALAAARAIYENSSSARRPVDGDQSAAPLEEEVMKAKKTKKAAAKPAKKAKPAPAKKIIAAAPAPIPAAVQKKPAGGKRAQIEADARAGKLPPIPDFSAQTHTRFRPKLAELVALAKAGDVKGLEAVEINPISTSPKAMDRYRNLAVIAIKAKKAA